MERTNRHDAENIWLKEFEVTIDNPENEMSYGAKIYPDFDNASPYIFSQNFSSYSRAID